MNGFAVLAVSMVMSLCTSVPVVEATRYEVLVFNNMEEQMPLTVQPYYSDEQVNLEDVKIVPPGGREQWKYSLPPTHLSVWAVLTWFSRGGKISKRVRLVYSSAEGTPKLVRKINGVYRYRWYLKDGDLHMFVPEEEKTLEDRLSELTLGQNNRRY